MLIHPQYCLIITVFILVAFTVFTVMFIIKNKKRAKRKYPFNYKKNNRFMSVLPYLGIVLFVYIFLVHGEVCTWKNVDMKNNADKIIEISKDDFAFYESSEIPNVQFEIYQYNYKDGEGIADYEKYIIPEPSFFGNLYRSGLSSEFKKDGCKIVVSPIYGDSILGLLRNGMYYSPIYVFPNDGYSKITITIPMKFLILQPIMMTHPKCDDLTQILSFPLFRAE